MSGPHIPHPGEIAPDFELPDSTKASRQLSALAAERPLILIFYRGYWSPFCLRQLAEYRDFYYQIRGAGANVAAVAVDEPRRSEAMRRRYKLPFPILCDTQRKVIEAWDLCNREEKGGIARPALFLLDRNLRVHCTSLDGEVTRVRAQEMLAYLRATSEARQPRQRVILPTFGELARTAWPVLRLTLFPPKK